MVWLFMEFFITYIILIFFKFLLSIVPVSLKVRFGKNYMIEVLGIKSCGLSFSDTFGALVSCERTLGGEILLAQETLFLDLVLIVDPIKESWDIESSM
jgi:hypothetical protein